MKKSKKHICGLAGLGLVAAITAVAQGIPIQGDVHATDTGGSSVNLNVFVHGEDPVADIAFPVNGSQISGNSVSLKIVYSNITTLKYTLKYQGLDGTTSTVELPEDIVADSADTPVSGIKEKTIDLSGYGYGTFTLTVRCEAPGGYYGEDTVQFSRSAIGLDEDTLINSDGTIKTDTNEKGDPVIKVTYGSTVQSIEIQAYDKNGNPIFPEPIIKEVPIDMDVSDIDIPFSEYGIEAGEYKIVLRAIDDNGSLVGVPVEFRVKYNPEEKGPALSVPNTGGITIGGLTISRADYIVSGLVIFGAAAAGGLFLMNRKKKSNKSRK